MILEESPIIKQPTGPNVKAQLLPTFKAQLSQKLKSPLPVVTLTNPSSRIRDMLCFRAARAALPFSSFPRFSSPRHRTLPSSFIPFKSSISAMSIATAAPPQTVEHIVLFKVKDDTDPSKINSMVSSLNGLISLDPVLHITVGPLYRTKSSPIPFTHMLHSRHSAKESLTQYSVHPSHVSVVTDLVRPICDDIMAVDWVADDVNGALTPPPGSVLRVAFLKLKENVGAEEKEVILGVIKEMKGRFQGIDQISCGENFSPGRAKGYSLASLAVFPGLNELEAVDSNEALVNLQKEKVRDYLESVIVLDYLVSSPQSASL